MINFTLHGVGTPNRPLEQGEASVWLSEHTLSDFLDVLLKFNDFTLTVDDANESDVRILLPALMARKLKAIFFIPAGKLGQEGYLTQKDILTLLTRGMEIGTHGMYHMDWRKLNNHELLFEINNSKKILEEITGQKIQKASCPYGSYDRRVLSFLRKASFQKVYTSDRGWADSKWWIQPRNSLLATNNSQTGTMIMAQPRLSINNLIRSTKKFIKMLR